MTTPALSSGEEDNRSEKDHYKELINDNEIHELLFHLTDIFSKLIKPTRETLNHLEYLHSSHPALKTLKPLAPETQKELLKRFDFSAFLERFQKPGLLVATEFDADDPRVQTIEDGDDPYEPPIIVNRNALAAGNEKLAWVNLDRIVRTNVIPVTTPQIIEDPSRLSLYVQPYIEQRNANLHVAVALAAQYQIPFGESGENINPWLLQYYTKESMLQIPIYYRATLFESALSFHYINDHWKQPGVFFDNDPHSIVKTINCVGLSEASDRTVDIPHTAQADILFSLIRDNIRPLSNNDMLHLQ